MIAVNFYNFSKKENSTKRPAAGTATVINCVLKDECSVESPVLELQTATPPALYTYAYIADFNRYYYVAGRSYYQGRWIVRLRTDILATYKDQIGASTQYVLRSASQSDGSIVDMHYPVKSGRTLQIQTADEPWDFRIESESGSDYPGNGCYVLGVVSANQRSRQALGTTMFYRLTPAGMADLISYLTSTFANQLTDSSAGFTDKIAKALVDPTEYIKTCIWFPFTINAVDITPLSLKFGWYDTGISSYCMDDLTDGIVSGAINIPKHPDAATRGVYLNTSPFSEYSFTLQPFGTVELDAGLIQSATSLYYKINVDLTSGLGTLEIYKDVSMTKAGMVASHTTQLGVNVPLTQTSGNTAGVIGTIAGTVAAVAAAPTTAGASLAAAGGIGTGLVTAQPHINGGMQQGGSFLPYSELCNKGPMISHVYYTQTAENNSHVGRPLCQDTQINTLSGYIQCADGELDISCTDSERAAITAYLTGGFFYE